MTPSLGAMLVVAALTLAGCGGPGGTAGQDGTGTPATVDAPTDAPLPDLLAHRTFVSTSVTGRTLAPGTDITLSFDDDDDVRAHAGCNQMSGTPVWDGEVLTVPEMGMTEMACEEPLMDQDQWFMDLLSSGVTVTLSGNELVLAAGDVTLDLLDRTVADPDRSLTGVTWSLDGIVSGTGDPATVSSVPQRLAVVLRIDSDRLDVFNGLTWKSAPLADGQDLSASSGTVRVTESLTGDAIGCAGGGTDCFVDVSVLGGDFDYTITADRLTVTGVGATDGRGLMLRAAPDGFAGPDLIGHTYRLTRLATDAGGGDTRYDDARFTITFTATGASAESQCATIRYPRVRYFGEDASMVDLGEPVGPACSLGSDPDGVPHGELMTGRSADGYFLSTGFVAWHFEQTG